VSNGKKLKFKSTLRITYLSRLGLPYLLGAETRGPFLTYETFPIHKTGCIYASTTNIFG